MDDSSPPVPGVIVLVVPYCFRQIILQALGRWASHDTKIPFPTYRYREECGKPCEVIPGMNAPGQTAPYIQATRVFGLTDPLRSSRLVVIEQVFILALSCCNGAQSGSERTSTGPWLPIAAP